MLKVLFRPRSGGIFLRLFFWCLLATAAAGGILSACQEHLPGDCWFGAGSMLCALGVMLSLILEERRMQHAMLVIKRKFGKNAIIRGMNLQKGATTLERNRQIGGHKSGT